MKKLLTSEGLHLETNGGKDIYIFLGPPGSGKGSLSQLCVKRLGWQQLSTGNLCREYIAQQSEIGKQIDFAIKSGKLIPDSLMLEMVNEWLAQTLSNQPAVIFDGFPRTVPQARALHELIESLKDVRMNILRMDITHEEVVSRLLARAICQNNKCQSVYSIHKHSTQQPKQPMTCDECESPLIRRSDDEESAIYERLKIYAAHERELRDFYESVGKPIQVISSNEPLETVYNKLIEHLGPVKV